MEDAPCLLWHCVDDRSEGEYEKEATRKNDPAGDHANERLPTLRTHLDTAQSLISNVAGGKR